MKLKSEEILMYKVMQALDQSALPLSFKGSMVLRACLKEAGLGTEIRQTVDVDANWKGANPPSMESMQELLEKALKNAGFEIQVRAYRNYGPGRSAGFDLLEASTGLPLFSMDIDVDKPLAPEQLYTVEALRFHGVAPEQMIADKVFVVSSDKVFRRIKDLIDLYYLSEFFSLDLPQVEDLLAESGRHLGDFNGFLHRELDLQHAYERFRFEGGVCKPDFATVYVAARQFLEPALKRLIES